MSDVTAVFAGTFDPVTHGHLDIVRRAARLFDRVVVSIARTGRDTLFTADERAALLRETLGSVDGVSVELFDGLLVEEARRHGARVLIRGSRSARDWDYEMEMALANRGLAPEIDTLFLPPSAGLGQVSSSLVREVARLGGDVSPWVPAAVIAALEAKLRG
jgi:pantetheine-phosphate adenylyltransferase